MHRARYISLLGLVGVAGAVALGQSTARRIREQDILSVQSLISQNKTDEAKLRLAELGNRYPGDAGFDNLRGVVAAQSGDLTAAETYFKQALRNDHHFLSAHLNLGRLYENKTATDPSAVAKSLREYDAALELQPDNSEANYQAAVLLSHQGRYHQSSLHLERLSPDERSRSQVASLELSDAAAQHHAVEIEKYCSILMANPDLSVADLEQALPGLTQGKRFDLEIRLISAFKEKNNLPDSLLASLANAYREQQSLSEARATYEDLYSRNGSVVSPLVALAEVARDQNDTQGALGYLAHARDLSPTDAGIRYSFGLACLDLNLLGEAQKSFKKAVDLEADNPDYNYAMGMTTSYMHEPGEGIPYLQKYMQLRPKDPKALIALGVTYFRAKEYDAGIPFLKSAAMIPATAATAHFYLGSIASQQGRPEDSIRELNLAINDDPKYADAFAERGQVYLTSKNYVAAQDDFEKALSIDPDHYSANFGLLTVYIRTKNSKRAEQAERFDAVQKLTDQKKQEYLRVVEARPIATAP